jgi:hypothetical protein
MSARPALRRSARVQAAKSATAGASERVSAVSVAAQSAAMGESAAESRERAAPDGPQKRGDTRKSAAPAERPVITIHMHATARTRRAPAT